MKRFALTILMLSIVVPPVSADTGFKFFEPITPPRNVQVMVHRGMARLAPENTRPALQAVIDAGFEWAEIDVRLTKDGHHVIFHDNRLGGKTNGKGLLRDKTLAELQELDAGGWFAERFAGEKILTLEDALQFAKGKLNFYLDCKTIDPARLVKDILDADMARQVIVFDDLKNLLRVREISNGRIPIMPKWRPKLGLESWIERIRPDAVEIDADAVTVDICKTFHQHGIKVQAKVLGKWDRPEMWDRVIVAGVDWLQTDLPGEIVARTVWQRIEKRPVRISCHRGALRFAPENTMPAFEKAVRLGVDFIEIDVRTTSDGKHYLLHDGNLNRTTNGSGSIRKTDSMAIDRLDAGSWFGRPFRGQAVPRFDDVLTTFGGKIGFYLDVKDISPDALAAALDRHGLVEQSVVYQWPQYLAKLKKIDGRIRLLAPLLSPKAVDKLADNLAPYAFDAKWDILSKELIATCHARGILVFSDAMGKHDNVADYLSAMRWGIDLIQTNHPMRVLRAIELFASQNETAR